MPRPKKVAVQQEAEEVIAESSPELLTVDSHKQRLEDLYQEMKDLGINSIGDVEVKLSRY